MKRRCIYCGKIIEDDGSVCPHCQGNNDVDKLDTNGIHKLHQACHSEINKNNDIKNSALTFVVTGTLLLIVGCFLLFLSFKKDVIGIRNFTPGSTEFVLSVLCLATSISFLTYGFIRLITSLKNLKFYKKTILDTNR